MPSPDFDQLPAEYQQLLKIASEKHNLDVTPLQVLTGGRTGAFVYLVSVSSGDSHRVEHFVVKFDHVKPKAKPTEVERHRMALSQAPALFASQNMAKLAYEVEHEGAVALFYTVAGQSLQRFRTLASQEGLRRLETLFSATSDYLLKEWNAAAVFERAVHPQKLLGWWLGHRLKADGPIASFLKDSFLLDPQTEGFLIEGQVFPNPWSYGLNAERWQGARPIDVLTGFQHGDLNLANILAKFADDSETLEGYFLIDFALYKPGMPLLYDLCYLEMSYLVRELERAPFQKWVSFVTQFSSGDMQNSKQVPVELAGACEVINTGRRSFQRWIEESHPSLSDDLWGQFWLAAVAAGLNFCNKPVSIEERLAGLIYSAAHLKRYCVAFGIPLPVDVGLLYDAGRWGEPASMNRSVSAELPRRSQAASPASSMRKSQLPSGTVTFLFTDIEGSTRLWEAYPESMKHALAHHYEILQRAVESHAGQVVETSGDGVLAVFSTTADGLAAALVAQKMLNAEDWGELGSDSIRVRMGLHTGEAEMQGGTYAGPVLNRAARLMSVGHGGQILLSTTTSELVRPQLPEAASLRDLGEHRLKDLVRSEHIYQLIHADLPADYPPLKSLSAFPNNLPIQLTSFIGRETELKTIRDLLMQGVRLVTLIGPGGTGKTRLSLQTAADLIDHFQDGVFFVDLAPIREPESVLAAVARTVGLRQTSDHPLLDELKGYLRERRMLLILDNFEQVTAAAPSVAELLAYCPELHMLVTSREALHMRGEHVFPVPPLGLPGPDLKQPTLEQLTQYEAVRLFIERAQAVKPDFQVTNENAPAVAEICFRLDGLPLAIELATARLRLFSPQALLERIGSRLKLLRGGPRDLPARQQTLRDTINWSYELLDPGEQRLFALVSVFPSCTFEAVEVVAANITHLDGTEIDVLDGLASLVDKSLIRQADREAREPRLLMLETIREYATERLEENPEFRALVHRAHAAYFADFALSQWERLTGGSREAALEAMHSELENIQAAWRYWVADGHLEQLHKITDSLWSLYDKRGWYHAMVDLTGDLLNVLASNPSTQERAQQEIMLQVSLARGLLATRGYTEEVEQAYARAMELCESAGEIPQLFPVLRGLASFYILRTEYDKAIQLGERMLQLAEHLGDTEMLIDGHMILGYNLAFIEDPRVGLDHLEKAMALYDPENPRVRRLGFGTNPGVTILTVSSLFLWMMGYPDQARGRAGEGIALAEKLNHPYSIAYAHFHNGLLHLWLRNPEVAQERGQSVLNLSEEHGFQIWSAVGTCLRGAALVAMGSVEMGLALIENGLEVYQGLKTPPVFWPLLLYLCAGAYRAASRPQEGLALMKKAIEFETKGSAKVLLSEFLILQGELLLALSSKNTGEAESCYRQAVDNARATHTAMLELRAAIRLGRLWQEQGKTEESKKLLEEAFSKMTEGFALPDLREASALLAELS